MEKGEVNWTEVNEIERAIENLEDNTNDCWKTLQTPRVLGKWPEKVKDELNSIMEVKESFEDATMCNHPKVAKVNLSCLKEQRGKPS